MKQPFNYRLMTKGIQKKINAFGTIQTLEPPWNVVYYSEVRKVYAKDQADAEDQLRDIINRSGKWSGFTIPVELKRADA